MFHFVKLQCQELTYLACNIAFWLLQNWYESWPMIQYWPTLRVTWFKKRKNTPWTYCVKLRLLQLRYLACNITLWITKLLVLIMRVKLRLLQLRYLACNITLWITKLLVLIMPFGSILEYKTHPCSHLVYIFCVGKHIFLFCWNYNA
jgi:hypothetical protein